MYIHKFEIQNKKVTDFCILTAMIFQIIKNERQGNIYFYFTLHSLFTGICYA